MSLLARLNSPGSYQPVGTAGVCGSKVSLTFEDSFPEPENPAAFVSAFQENTSFNSGAGAAQTAAYKEEK